MLETHAKRLDLVVALQETLLERLRLCLGRLRALDCCVDFGAQLDEFLSRSGVVSLHGLRAR